jgi:hypothetical protein
VRSTRASLAAAVFVALWPISQSAAADGRSLRSRDIGCAEISSGRPRQICDAIAASLTWQWMGHATVAPGYKPSFDGVRKVYCELKIVKGDVESLQSLIQYDPSRKWVPDWRLESEADMLLRIVASLDGASGGEPPNSIFSPQNPDYLLKSGCP